MTLASPGSNVSFALRAAGITGALLWWFCLKAYSSRTMYLLYYAAQAIVGPRWEVFVPTSLATLAILLCGLIFWIGANELVWRRLRDTDDDNHTAAQRQWAWGVGYLIAASVPWLIDLAIHWQTAEPLVRATGLWGPTVWQPLWCAGFSGLAAERFMRALQASHLQGRTANRFTPSREDRGLAWSVGLVAVLCGAWWFFQSQRAFDEFMLGFNDCGHFAQRIANTAGGRGWLVESPVLPRFWDHFNPGLTLLVPLWFVWPHMSLFFLLQALSLAGCAPLIMQLARALGASPRASAVWACAWLTQPVLGQMNLAYSYGWHPISLAIPLLLIALLCVLQRRWWIAAAAAVLASSMEEGVLVIIATTAATLAAIELWAWLSQRSNAIVDRPAQPKVLPSSFAAARRISALLPARAWIAVAALASLAFVLIFRFSGLAQFQTGRFHKLGSSTLEIVLSPVLRPAAFWGLLLRSRNAVFLAGLLLPSSVIALRRAWPLLLATLLPIGVLVAWDHLPAQSLAFQYSSVLLPVIWLTAIAGATSRSADTEVATDAIPAAKDSPRHLPATALTLGAAALATSLVASIYFGQMPWSGKTLSDVSAVTYDFGSQLLRRAGKADNQFAHEQLAVIAQRQESVLATGRLATHLVGCSELETVGQFAERRKALSKLTPGEHPLRRYRWLILDRRESFQQSRAQTAALEQEGLANGFEVVADQFDIVVLERD